MFDTILTRDIRQALDDFRRSVDRLFSDVYESQPVARSENIFTPVVESAFTENELMLRVLLPGVTEPDVKVTVQNGWLAIEGERKAPESWDDNAWTKIAYGKFYTEISIPNGLDLDKVNCRLHDGVLDVQLPVAEGMKPRRIPIDSVILRDHIGCRVNLISLRSGVARASAPLHPFLVLGCCHSNEARWFRSSLLSFSQ